MKKTPKHTKAGRKIIAAFRFEQAAHAQGAVRSIRMIELPDEPGVHTAEGIAKLRGALGVSQAVFARLLGVSTVLVSHVEQGRRKPSLMLRRMLDLMKSNPEPWLALVKPKAAEQHATGLESSQMKRRNRQIHVPHAIAG
jgi:DNA-binding transcriptional regulator YiaG